MMAESGQTGFKSQ